MKIHNRLDTPNMDKWRKSQGQSTVTVLGKKRGGCGQEMVSSTPDMHFIALVYL